MLSSVLAVEDILLDVPAPTKQHLFALIGEHMARAHGVIADAVVSALQRREMAGSTAVGHGVAIPHARVTELGGIRALYLRLTPPLECETPDHERVSHVVVLMVPAPATQEHLDLLAETSALFLQRGFRESLHRCLNAMQVKALFDAWPQ